MRLRWRVVIGALLAGVLVLVPGARKGQLAAEPAGQVIEAGGVRWRVSDVPEPDVFRAHAEGSADIAALLKDDLAGDFTLQPVVRNPAELLRFNGGEDAAQDIATWSERIMQAVPGVPEHNLFDGLNLGNVRAAFSAECIEAASGYVAGFGALLQTESFASALSGVATKNLSDRYEKNCLVRLDALPLPIRQVTGVLSKKTGPYWATFCSATIVGPRRLVTSRHCFFDADSGEPQPTWTELENGTIGFYSLIGHNGSTMFSVRRIGAGPVANDPFAPYDDIIELEVIEGPFEHEAKRAAAPLDPARLPAPVWLVGNNALLGDVQRQLRPLEYVRGAKPDACSVLHVTATGCLYHSCQAGSSTSGAGLLLLENDTVTMVGVHKGPLSRGGACDDDVPVNLALNLAARVQSAP